MATSPNRNISVEEYLKFEDAAVDRHEYLNGEIFLMGGGTLNHSTIATNIITALANQLADSDCLVRGADARIRTSPSGLYSYSDAVVSCGEDQVEDNSLLNPLLIVEVLSKNTENYDRGKKFELCRQIESFSEYVIVAQDRIYVEHHVRASQVWTMRVYQDRDAVVDLQTLAAFLRLADVYRKVL